MSASGRDNPDTRRPQRPQPGHEAPNKALVAVYDNPGGPWRVRHWHLSRLRVIKPRDTLRFGNVNNSWDYFYGVEEGCSSFSLSKRWMSLGTETLTMFVLDLSWELEFVVQRRTSRTKPQTPQTVYGWYWGDPFRGRRRDGNGAGCGKSWSCVKTKRECSRKFQSATKVLLFFMKSWF